MRKRSLIPALGLPGIDCGGIYDVDPQNGWPDANRSRWLPSKYVAATYTLSGDIGLGAIAHAGQPQLPRSRPARTCRRPFGKGSARHHHSSDSGRQAGDRLSQARQPSSRYDPRPELSDVGNPGPATGRSAIQDSRRTAAANRATPFARSTQSAASRRKPFTASTKPSNKSRFPSCSPICKPGSNTSIPISSGHRLQPEEALGQNPRLLKSGETPPDHYRRLGKPSPMAASGPASFTTGVRMAHCIGNGPSSVRAQFGRTHHPLSLNQGRYHRPTSGRTTTATSRQRLQTRLRGHPLSPMPTPASSKSTIPSAC